MKSSMLPLCLCFVRTRESGHSASEIFWIELFSQLTWHAQPRFRLICSCPDTIRAFFVKTRFHFSRYCNALTKKYYRLHWNQGMDVPHPRLQLFGHVHKKAQINPF